MKINKFNKISKIEAMSIFLACSFFPIVYVGSSTNGLVLSIVMLAASITWIKSDEVDLKIIISGCLFIYPLLPRLWGFRIGEGIPALTAHRVLCIAIILFLIRKKLFVKYYRDFFKADIFTTPIIFVLISLLITTFVTENKPGTFFFMASYFFETILIPVIIFSTYKTKEDIDKLISIIVYPAIILAFLGVFEYHTEFNIYSLFGNFAAESGTVSVSRRFDILRIKGCHTHPIAFGSYFALIMPFMLYKFKNKIISQLLLLLLLFYATTKTDSRSAQIGFIIVLFVFILFVSKTKILFFLASPLPLLSASFRYRLMILNPFFAGNVVLASSSLDRLDQFNFLINYIKRNIVLGVGQVEPPSLLRFLTGTGLGDYNTTVDNFYLLHTWFYGLCGLFSWCFLMCFVVIKTIFVFREKIFQDDLVLLILAGIGAFCVINLVVALYSFHFVFWIYVGILTRLLYNFQNNN